MRNGRVEKLIIFLVLWLWRIHLLSICVSAMIVVRKELYVFRCNITETIYCSVFCLSACAPVVGTNISQ